jgi:hypothetical protein
LTVGSEKRGSLNHTIAVRHLVSKGEGEVEGNLPRGLKLEARSRMM